jgi:hypothetical protein
MSEGEQPPYEEAGFSGDAHLDHGDMVSSTDYYTLFCLVYCETELIFPNA